MSYLDTKRFDHLNDAEVLQRIGVILAIGVGRLEEQRLMKAIPIPGALVLRGRQGPQQFVMDAEERRIIDQLQKTKTATVRELAQNLGLTREAIFRKLQRLRHRGLCETEGRGGGTRYRLRTEFSSN